MSTSLGIRAETLAAEYLQAGGFKILVRNHRTRWSELDIVAFRDGVVHFVEVKYRSNPDYGSGFEYITPDKLRRLSRAAEMFMTASRKPGAYQIDVVAVTGAIDSPSITFLENVTA